MSSRRLIATLDRGEFLFSAGDVGFVRCRESFPPGLRYADPAAPVNSVAAVKVSRTLEGIPSDGALGSDQEDAAVQGYVPAEGVSRFTVVGTEL
jgi:hypothetical protein